MTAQRELDNRGKACPLPVINTKKALEKMVSGELVCLVDNETAKENVSFFLKQQGYPYSVEEMEGGYRIIIKKEKEVLPEKELVGESAPSNKKAAESETTLAKKGKPVNETAYLIISDCLGRGADELGKVLMESFIYTVAEQRPFPGFIIFINKGVYLALEDSAVIEHLKLMQEEGTDVISCGTCLEYYKVKDKLEAGRISNMYEINKILCASEKVITIS